MKHKVAELAGTELDAAVALAEGDRLPDFWRDPDDGTCWSRPGREEWQPSERWSQGGPISEHALFDISRFRGGDMAWIASYGDPEHLRSETGPTFLVAAMRAYVASRFGDEVDLPEAQKE